MTGAEFIASLHDAPLGPVRNAAILAALDATVVWPMCPVPITDDAGAVRGSFDVAADYFAIGTPDDFVRVSADGPTAQKIADKLGLHLLTPRMVGLLNKAAGIRIQPILRAAAPAMTSVAWFVWHSQAMSEAVLAFVAANPDTSSLVSDVKKNVVLSNRRVGHLGQLALFGEHVATYPVRLALRDGSPRIVQPGQPIQDLTLFHEAGYADESHGLRLCSATVTIDGKTYSTAKALQDPEVAHLLSDEGPLADDALGYRSPS